MSRLQDVSDDEETKPLLANSAPKSPSSSDEIVQDDDVGVDAHVSRQKSRDGQPLAKSRIVKPKRLVVIEPLMAVIALSGFPIIQLQQQFVYQEMTRSLATEYGVLNMSLIPSTTQSPCNITTTNNGTLSDISLEAQVLSSKFIVYLGLATAIPAIFVSAFLGGYSDRAGRKYAIVPGMLGMLARTATYAIVSGYGLSVWWMMIGALLDGVSGSYHVLLSGCYAYLADVTEPERRLFRITVAELCIYVSTVIAPVGIGYWVLIHGFTGPFLLLLGLMVVGTLYAIFFVPETVKPRGRVTFFSVSHVRNTAALFLIKDPSELSKNRRTKIALLLTAFVIGSMCFSGAATFFFLFLMNEPLCWSSAMIGIFSVFYLGVSSAGAAVAARLLRLCTRDEAIVLLAAVAAMVDRTYVGFVQKSFMMFLIPFVSSFAFLLLPTLRAIMSKLAYQYEQGSMFAGMACLEVVINFLGSTTFTMVYAATLHIHTGFVFFIMAMFYVLAVVVLIVYNAMTYKERKFSKDVVSETTVIAEKIEKT